MPHSRRNNALIERRIYFTFGTGQLTAFDYFLWGYGKAHVYTEKPASIAALADNIEALIREIPTEMLERVCQNWTKRMGHVAFNICMNESSNIKLYGPYYRFQ